ncbi:hypothetical protein SLOPH_966 [Spraguea lophii 42_110]|uniref:Uncharacterized protein n=1 Tax=Spraguea lophii (strain 42_110) TaxID=1358809 RepID=S7W7T8_SPRLO|nr:hypothetical protein SLOPH_966 [Spraguea lophii 42_110]
MQFSLKNALLAISLSIGTIYLFIYFIYDRPRRKEEERRINNFFDDQEKCGFLVKNKKDLIDVLFFTNSQLRGEILEAEKKGERLSDECIKKLKELDEKASDILRQMRWRDLHRRRGI